MTAEQALMMAYVLWAAGGVLLVSGLLLIVIKKAGRWSVPWWQVWACLGFALLGSAVLGASGYQHHQLHKNKQDNEALQEALDKNEVLREQLKEEIQNRLDSENNNPTQSEESDDKPEN